MANKSPCTKTRMHSNHHGIAGPSYPLSSPSALVGRDCKELPPIEPGEDRKQEAIESNCPDSCCPTADSSCTGLSSSTKTRESIAKAGSTGELCCKPHVNGLKDDDRFAYDLESAQGLELVKIRVVGMSCTGCARKVSGMLSSIKGVSGISINFIASTAEFNLAPGGISSANIIQTLERGTGFTCSRVQLELQTLDLILSCDKAVQFAKFMPPGVHSINMIEDVYAVIYNPEIIGARSLFEISGARALGPLRTSSDLTAGKDRLLRLSANFILALCFTIPVVVLEWSDNRLAYTTRSAIVIIFATIVQITAIPEFYMGALKSLLHSRIVEMDMLVVISITSAYIYSIVAFVLRHEGYELEQGEFFETSALLITLVLLGRVISAYAKHRAINAVSFNSIQADKALLIGEGQIVHEIDARLLEYKDIILIPPHSKIVTDGILVSGNGFVDESMITGESNAVPKTLGDPVVAGTLNGDTAFTVQITRLPGRNSITDISNLVEQALASKPWIQDLADRMASYFIPTIIAIALAVFLIWIIISLKVRGLDAGGATGTAITYAIAVLAISCPCALGLAVPMVLIIAGGVSARFGVIIKRADAIEGSHKVTDVVFDKTGTLTDGDLKVQQRKILTSMFGNDDVQALISGLVKGNEHPVSRAIAKYEAEKDARVIDLTSVKSIPGSGLEALWNDQEIRAGNPYWLGLSDDSEVRSGLRQGSTVFCVTVDQQLVAVYSLTASVRTEARLLVQELIKRRITTHIVSGDGHEAVSTIAAQLGIPPTNVRARHTPAEKQAYVKRLMDQGGYVLFCGDGTNDAVAISQAHVGVHIGNTSDMTKALADVVLLGGLEGILDLLKISQRAYNRIIFNFAWSFIYNLFAILLASGAFVKVRIPPAYAGLGEIVSILPIIFAALSLVKTNWW